MKRLMILAVLLLVVSADSMGAPLRDGDLIFQTSRSAQSLAIMNATHSKYSHMGILFFRGKEPYVFEAVKTVRFTPLKTWIARGEGGRYVVKRLRDADHLLTPEAIARLRREAETMKGKPYDPLFSWSDEKIYCSELVWKIYERALGIGIGRLQKLRDFDLSQPLVRRKLKERYGSRLPLDEEVISPQAMFAFDGLSEVVAK